MVLWCTYDFMNFSEQHFILQHFKKRWCCHFKFRGIEHLLCLCKGDSAGRVGSTTKQWELSGRRRGWEGRTTHCLRLSTITIITTSPPGDFLSPASRTHKAHRWRPEGGDACWSQLPQREEAGNDHCRHRC